MAAVEVAEWLAAIAIGDPLGTRQEIAGPQVHDLLDLAGRVEARHARPRRIIPLPVLGKAARGAAGSALLPGADATLGTVTFDDWLTAERP